MTDKLGIGESRDCFGCMPVHSELTSSETGTLQVAKQFGEPENPDTIAVVSPSVVEHVRLRSAGRKFGAQAFAERKPFEVEADIDGEAFAAWPVVDSTGGNGRVGVAIVGGCGHGENGSRFFRCVPANSQEKVAPSLPAFAKALTIAQSIANSLARWDGIG